MLSEYLIVRRVEFADTDMAGIMHFSNFFRFMEVAETDFLRAAGIEPICLEPGSVSGWPRVRASCDYHAPVRFGDEVEVHLFVKEIRIRAVCYFFRFRKRDGATSAEPVARGEMVTVRATADRPGGAMQALPLDDDILARIGPAPRERYARG
ncbi:MAG: acyl-CoA thioesterase [Puniceicoccaceae bacterium]|nr:MAG: acyl-CoA thioesterase [Puniceicoccaceae bacterium]